MTPEQIMERKTNKELLQEMTTHHLTVGYNAYQDSYQWWISVGLCAARMSRQAVEDALANPYGRNILHEWIAQIEWWKRPDDWISKVD